MASASWLNGWVTGDLVTATEFAKGVGSIYDTTLTGSAASIDINPPIPAGYAHLLLIVYARGDTAAATTGMFVRFNNDSTANYDYQAVAGAAAVASANENFTTTSAAIGVIPANTAGANLFGMADVMIPHYAGAANNKLFWSRYAYKTGTSSGNLSTGAEAGHWRSNTAITRITILPAAGNFVTGSKATLYVLGA